ncbi:MAG TPA: hypothetical protein VIC08_09955 [Cellvibrionaceae bacterium]
MPHSSCNPLTEGALPVMHKVLRCELFKTSDALAQAECDNIDPLQQQLQTVAALLRSHGRDEDLEFEALLREYDPMLANILEDDHLKLEADLVRLLSAVQALSNIAAANRQAPLQQLYMDWNLFVGHYLLHMDDEERRLLVVIKEHMPPLSRVRQSIDMFEPQPRQRFIKNLKQVTTLHEQQHILGSHTQNHNSYQKEPA